MSKKEFDLLSLKKFREALTKEGPRNIPVYIENVGGEQFTQIFGEIEMNKEKELTQGERYVIAQTMDDFENAWNDHQEFDDMGVPRLRSELTKEQLELLNQNKDE